MYANYSNYLELCIMCMQKRLLDGRSEGRLLDGRSEGRLLDGRSEERLLDGRSEGRILDGKSDGRLLDGRSEGRLTFYFGIVCRSPRVEKKICIMWKSFV